MKRVISALAAVFVFAALFFGIMIPADCPPMPKRMNCIYTIGPTISIPKQ